MFSVPLIALTGAEPITPTLGARTLHASTDNTDQFTKTISHNSVTGNVLIAFVSRTTSTADANPAALWGAAGAQDPVPSIVQAGVSDPGEHYCGIFFIRNGFVGTGDATLNFSGAMREILFWVQDVSTVPPAHIGASVAVTFNTLDTTVAAAITPENALSLLVAIAGFGSGGADPLSSSAGWTELVEGQTGTTTNRVCASLSSRTAGGTSPQTLTVTATVGDTDRVLAIAELLPL
jgi:hypothetical protein